MRRSDILVKGQGHSETTYSHISSLRGVFSPLSGMHQHIFIKHHLPVVQQTNTLPANPVSPAKSISAVGGWTWKIHSDISFILPLIFKGLKVWNLALIKVACHSDIHWFRNGGWSNSGLLMVVLCPVRIWCSLVHSPLRTIDWRPWKTGW